MRPILRQLMHHVSQVIRQRKLARAKEITGSTSRTRLAQQSARARDPQKCANSRFRNWCCPGHPSDEDHDRCGIEERGCGIDGGFEIPCEAPVAIDPGDETLHNPSAWQDDETHLIGLLSDDFDDDSGGCRHPLMIVSAIGPYELDERKQGTRHPKQRPGAASILNVGRTRFDKERARPSVSTSAWRLRPLIFLPAS